MRGTLCLLLFVALTASAAGAATYLVLPDGSGDFRTIQEAIMSVAEGDVIELGNGIFRGHENRDLDPGGKDLTIRSQSGDPTLCVIDCEGTPTEGHRGFYFMAGETSATQVQGISIINGYAWMHHLGRGGAVYCSMTGPQFIDCIFAHNTAEDGGGAVWVVNNVSFVNFTNCAFSDNRAQDGGAVRCSPGSLTFDHCSFSGNVATYSGGAVTAGTGSLRFMSCTFAGNSAGAGGCVASSSYRVENCTMYANRAPYGSAVSGGTTGSWVLYSVIVGGSSPPVDGGDLLCCDLWGNSGGDWVGPIAGQFGINGNISKDPMFCDPEGGEFTLDCISPCQPGNSPDCGLIGAWPIGCGDPAAIPEPPDVEAVRTWGAVKAMFRGR